MSRYIIFDEENLGSSVKMLDELISKKCKKGRLHLVNSIACALGSFIGSVIFERLDTVWSNTWHSEEEHEKHDEEKAKKFVVVAGGYVIAIVEYVKVLNCIRDLEILNFVKDNIDPKNYIIKKTKIEF